MKNNGPTGAKSGDHTQAAGIQIEDATGRSSLGALIKDAERLITMRSHGVRVWQSGPNGDETRVEVTVAKGSFANAAKDGTDVITELNPRVPVVIFEGAEQPRPA